MGSAPWTVRDSKREVEEYWGQGEVAMTHERKCLKWVIHVDTARLFPDSGAPACIPILIRIGVSLISLYDASFS
jgi:hypothetical protein